MAYSGIRFGQGLNIFPVSPAKDNGGNTTDTPYVDLIDANWVTFLFILGNLTSDATDTITFVVDCSTDGSTTGEACAFWYRLSSAYLTNGWGAITAGSSDGTAIVGATDDNKMIIIDVDPAVVGAAKAGARYCRVEFVAVGPIALTAGCAVVEHRYPGNTMSSS